MKEITYQLLHLLLKWKSLQWILLFCKLTFSYVRFHSTKIFNGDNFTLELQKQSWFVLSFLVLLNCTTVPSPRHLTDYLQWSDLKIQERNSCYLEKGTVMNTDNAKALRVGFRLPSMLRRFYDQLVCSALWKREDQFLTHFFL